MFMPCLLCNGVISQRSCVIVWYDVCIMCNHRFNMSDVFANVELYLHNMFTNAAYMPETAVRASKFDTYMMWLAMRPRYETVLGHPLNLSISMGG